ncbi:MAG TPA: hypothetical protein VLT58_13150, partial [Polyangia bacterium]|nr:hypothetical protein [Polyangia bacterium]
MPAALHDRESKTSGARAGRARAVRRLLLLASIVAGLAVAVPYAAQAAATKLGPPKVSTGGTNAVHGTSATLLGTVDPNGLATSYYFQYGPTLAYGKQTTPGNLPAGTARTKVGQVAAGLLTGYHYRLVAKNEKAERVGRDRTFGVKRTTTTTKLNLAKSSPSTTYGETYVLSGTVSGPGAANRALVLQASPYPYLEAFATVGVAGHSDAAGRFSFRVAKLTKSTQFRVSTLDPRPIYSRTVTQQVAVKVTLKVRTSGHPGLVRLYGTVTPAKPGAHLDFQLLKKVRPGNTPKAEERTTKYASQFSTLVKRATASVSRFSVVVKIRRGGSYRAYVRLSSKGAVVSGWSRSLLL